MGGTPASPGDNDHRQLSTAAHRPEGEPPSVALQVRGLTKTYGERRVVNDVSFKLDRGEVFGFLGPNGSGKTTTMRMALDLIKPDSGSVSMLGSAPTRGVLRRVGYVPEERGLFQRARVMDVLRYLGRLKGLTSTEAEARAAELMSRVGLAEHLGAKVQGLSRGMTQLVQFVGALLHRPDLIILDEPFSGLDPLNVVLMKEIIREEQARALRSSSAPTSCRTSRRCASGRSSSRTETCWSTGRSSK